MLSVNVGIAVLPGPIREKPLLTSRSLFESNINPSPVVVGFADCTNTCRSGNEAQSMRTFDL